MRHRRANRSTWFPILGQSGFDDIQPSTWIYYSDGISTGEIISEVTVQPLVNDQTQNAGGTGVSLRDVVEGQTWRCDRIVGNISVIVQPQQEGETDRQNLIACAAIAVLPVDDETQSPELVPEEMTPLGANQSAQPWLWRRTWVLGNAFSEAPSHNMERSSLREGSFCDTKGVKRLIQREQRLFMLTQIAYIDKSVGQNNLGVNWVIDLRVLGQLVKKHNRSTFK